MTNDDLRKYVQQILTYLKSDFDAYEDARKKGVTIGAGSYLLTASSGIDFLGSLAVPDVELKQYEINGKGLKNKSTAGSKWYINNFLSEVNPKYGNAGVPNFVYTALRCGQVHEGTVKRGVLIGTKHPEYHLSILKIRESEADTTTIDAAYVNTRMLAQEFISSISYFVKNIIDQDQSVSKLTDRLSEHLRATSNPSESVDLPRHQLDEDTFEHIYDFSSASPQDSVPRYSLKARFWEVL